MSNVKSRHDNRQKNRAVQQVTGQQAAAQKAVPANQAELTANYQAQLNEVKAYAFDLNIFKERVVAENEALRQAVTKIAAAAGFSAESGIDIPNLVSHIEGLAVQH